MHEMNSRFRNTKLLKSVSVLARGNLLFTKYVYIHDGVGLTYLEKFSRIIRLSQSGRKRQSGSRMLRD